MSSGTRGRTVALTMTLAFLRLLASALSRLPRVSRQRGREAVLALSTVVKSALARLARVSHRIWRRMQPVQHLQARSVRVSRGAGTTRTLPLKTLALIAGILLPAVAGFAVLSRRGDLSFSNVALAESPAHPVETSSPVPGLKIVADEPPPASSSLPAPRLVSVEPIKTASISDSSPIPMTAAVAPLRPAHPRESVTRTPEPTAKSPEPRAPLARPEANSSPVLSSAEAAAYLGRAETTMRNGDLVGARSLFGRMAQAGDPRGALGMARTYDEAEFKKLGVYGLKPDRGEAERWRARARELTSAAGRN